MSFAGWLHTAVRKDSRALALFADAEDLADEAGDGMPPQQRVPGDTWPACRAARVAQYAHQQPHWPPPGADAAQHTYDLLQTAPAYLRTSRTPSG